MSTSVMFMSNYIKMVFNEARELELQALEIHSNPNNVENPDPYPFYKAAYNRYQTIAENEFLDNRTRGKAAYCLYRLAMDGKVFVSPTADATSEQRVHGFLVWAAECGYEKAQNELDLFNVDYVPTQGNNALRDGLMSKRW